MNALASSFRNAGIVYISQPVNYVINSEPASISDTRETLESCPPPPPPSTYSFFHNLYLVTFFLYNLNSFYKWSRKNYLFSSTRMQEQIITEVRTRYIINQGAEGVT